MEAAKHRARTQGSPLQIWLRTRTFSCSRKSFSSNHVNQIISIAHFRPAPGPPRAREAGGDLPWIEADRRYPGGGPAGRRRLKVCFSVQAHGRLFSVNLRPYHTQDAVGIGERAGGRYERISRGDSGPGFSVRAWASSAARQTQVCGEAGAGHHLGESGSILDAGRGTMCGHVGQREILSAKEGLRAEPALELVREPGARHQALEQADVESRAVTRAALRASLQVP